MREQYRIPLEGCLNFRDLGGYTCADGKMTRTGKLFRADSLAKLTDKDIAAVEAYGITSVLDLRFPYEAAEGVNRLRGREGIAYRNISVADKAQDNPLDFPDTNAEFYINILRMGGAEVAAVMRFFLENAYKSIVFHCTAGKDRTGVVAALLLDLAGVSRADIVADYALTHRYMWDSLIPLKALMEAKLGVQLKESMFAALPESMEAFLDELHSAYGGAAGYLTAQGLTEAEMDALRSMLLT